MLELLYLIILLVASFYVLSFIIGFIISIMAMIYSVLEFLFTSEAGKPFLYAIIIILIIVTML